MFFQPYYLGCLAHASYLMGGTNGEAAVIDPRRDVEEYIEDAKNAGLSIKYVIETHLHADFVSGHVELAKRTGATILLGTNSGASFSHQQISGGETLTLGDLTLTFLATPGHTPEGITIFAAALEHPTRLFTGDTLFLGDVGRPDLVGAKGLTSEQMAQMLYTSLREKILPLDDAVEIWPAHGAGSSCGKNLSDDRVSTLAVQKAVNLPLRLAMSGDEAGFIAYSIEGLGAPPPYFFHDAAKNKEGGASVEDILRPARALTPGEVEERSEDGVLVLDTRATGAFKAGHIPGAIEVQLDGNFAPYVGAVLPPTAPVIVVTEPGRETEAMTRLIRVGYENLLGWLGGGMEAWKAAGGELARATTLEPGDLKALLAAGAAPSVLDVRTPGEWEAGHIEGAIHIPITELNARLQEVPQGPLAVICGSGYRSAIAVSLLLRTGRTDVADVPGGWKAYNTG
ncbi:rhodanese-like domain-containing protein [Armatimonas sp.]|uniref:MBL fold metallo-hydrolase n=1 Tax=Armatimonas sp. TaxID=1872638 RepID=UPI0037519B83